MPVINMFMMAMIHNVDRRPQFSDYLRIRYGEC